ncbi:hypothetical protein [Streptomyces sp. NPDC127190]|uniref:hypothetical protein n=1 Tax=unclassified Streptomyces TaxID=2593676 RepID=UPI00363A3B12
MIVQHALELDEEPSHVLAAVHHITAAMATGGEEPARGTAVRGVVGPRTPQASSPA